MELSKRLMRIASFVRPGSRIADVGTDHGYIPIYLLKEGIAVSAVAMDINAGPLARAEENCRLYGVSDRISLRRSDGLTALKPGEADTVIIAGMGGQLVRRILAAGGHVTGQIERFILSPQSELRLVRQYLRENGYRIAREDMLTEEGKYYTVMEAVHQSGAYIEEQQPEALLEDRYGKYLLETKNPVLKEFIEKEEKKLETIAAQLAAGSSETAKDRYEEICAELVLLRAASAYF